MTMPRGHRGLVVDGRDYRWCVSRGAILVERVGSSGLVREILDARAPIGPGRVAQLVRHALGVGWNPEESRPFEVPSADPFADPRGRDDYTWRRALARVLTWFQAYVGTPVELGAYWWEGPEDHASAGLGARLRWGPCAALPEAEHWEGALALSGNRGESAHCSISGFPFIDGSMMRWGEEVDYGFMLHREGDGGRFEAHGWTYWDGPGEWEYVQRTDDLFHDNERVVQARGSSLIITPLEHEHPESGRLGVALHAIHGEHGEVLLEPAGAPWAPGPTRWIDDGPTLEVDVSRLGHRDRWRPGRARVAVRVHGLSFGDGEQSFVTQPVEITIPASPGVGSPHAEDSRSSDDWAAGTDRSDAAGHPGRGQ